jgi:hypothetical protein
VQQLVSFIPASARLQFFHRQVDKLRTLTKPMIKKQRNIKLLRTAQGCIRPLPEFCPRLMHGRSCAVVMSPNDGMITNWQTEFYLATLTLDRLSGEYLCIQCIATARLPGFIRLALWAKLSTEPMCNGDSVKPKQPTRRKTCPSATLTTVNLTWADPESNPGLREQTPATNRLNRHCRLQTKTNPTYV